MPWSSQTRSSWNTSTSQRMFARRHPLRSMLCPWTTMARQGIFQGYFWYIFYFHCLFLTSSCSFLKGVTCQLKLLHQQKTHKLTSSIQKMPWDSIVNFWIEIRKLIFKWMLVLNAGMHALQSATARTDRSVGSSLFRWILESRSWIIYTYSKYTYMSDNLHA